MTTGRDVRFSGMQAEQPWAVQSFTASRSKPPPPVFSPSHLCSPSNKNVKVLQSIFFPTLPDAQVEAFVGSSQCKGEETKPETPAKKNPSADLSAPKELNTISWATPLKTTNDDDADDNDLFFSPQQAINNSQISELSASPGNPPQVKDGENKENVQAQLQNNWGEHSPGKVFFNGDPANLSRITLGNTTLDSIEPSKSTLNFSLSPHSTLQGIELIDTPSVQEHVGGKSFFPETKSRLGSITETNSQVQEVNDKQKLSEEVKLLSSEAMEIENSRIGDQESFVKTLEELENAKQEAELLVKSLALKVEQADSQKQTLVENVQKLQKEQKEAQWDLEKGRCSLKRKDDEARVLERKLQAKIAELTKALSSSTERSRLVMGAEKGLRMQREKELAEQNQENEHLNKSLRETHENLAKLQHRHASFRMELLRALGVSDTEVSEGLDKPEIYQSIYLSVSFLFNI